MNKPKASRKKAILSYLVRLSVSLLTNNVVSTPVYSAMTILEAAILIFSALLACRVPDFQNYFSLIERSFNPKETPGSFMNAGIIVSAIVLFYSVFLVIEGALLGRQAEIANDKPNANRNLCRVLSILSVFLFTLFAQPIIIVYLCSIQSYSAVSLTVTNVLRLVLTLAGLLAYAMGYAFHHSLYNVYFPNDWICWASTSPRLNGLLALSIKVAASIPIAFLSSIHKSSESPLIPPSRE